MNIRIQTYGTSVSAILSYYVLTRGTTEGNAVDALKKGLVDLQEACDVVADEFWTKRQQYNAEQGLVR